MENLEFFIKYELISFVLEFYGTIFPIFYFHTSRCLQLVNQRSPGVNRPHGRSKSALLRCSALMPHWISKQSRPRVYRRATKSCTTNPLPAHRKIMSLRFTTSKLFAASSLCALSGYTYYRYKSPTTIQPLGFKDSTSNSTSRQPELRFWLPRALTCHFRYDDGQSQLSGMLHLVIFSGNFLALFL